MKTLSQTKKKYTVELSCCDPVFEVYLKNTNSIERARLIYNAVLTEMKGSEIEWTVFLWEHTLNSSPKVSLAELFESKLQGEHIYYVTFENSILLKEAHYSQFLSELN